MKYKSPILEKMLNEMSKDKWHVKLLLRIKLWYWIVYCLVFNNKYIRQLKDEREKAKDELIDLYSNELSNNAVFLAVHGIKTPDEKIQKGKELRAKIASLTEQIETINALTGEEIKDVKTITSIEYPEQINESKEIEIGLQNFVNNMKSIHDDHEIAEASYKAVNEMMNDLSQSGQAEEKGKKTAEDFGIIVNEVFADNGEHSHYQVINAETGENLWSEDPEEDKARGYAVHSPSHQSEVTDEEIKEWIEKQFTTEDNFESQHDAKIIKGFVKEGMFAGAKAMRDRKIT